MRAARARPLVPAVRARTIPPIASTGVSPAQKTATVSRPSTDRIRAVRAALALPTERGRTRPNTIAIATRMITSTTRYWRVAWASSPLYEPQAASAAEITNAATAATPNLSHQLLVVADAADISLIVPPWSGI